MQRFLPDRMSAFSALIGPTLPSSAPRRRHFPKDIQMPEITLQNLKLRTPTELLAFAEEHEVENASILRKQD